MGKKKYYAVRNGKIPGIYESWEECKSMIDRYSNAEYKAFGSKEDAYAYLKNISISDKNKEAAKKNDSVIAYVDGSYCDKTKKYSYGCILITPSGEILKKSGKGSDPKALSIRNIAGELQGAMSAVKLALELGYKKIIIRHDYIGISNWYTGEWKAKDEITKKYVDYLTRLQDRIEIKFEKVKAHSGDEFNEKADQLAKSALEESDVKVSQNNKSTYREKILKEIQENIMESKEVLLYLDISNQKLTSMNKNGKLIPIKKGIYLKMDVEGVKKIINK